MTHGRIGEFTLWCMAVWCAACTSPRGDTPVKEETATPAALECTLRAPPRVRAGEPVKVQFRLGNRTSQPMFVLSWRTPLEGLFGNDWQVTRDGVEVPYEGPMVKRADPEAEDYVAIAPGAAAEAEVEVSLAYDMRQPGRYRIALRGPLMDVITTQAEVPRPLSRLRAMPIACPVVQTEVVAP
jgi:hypothetical protein